VPEHLALVVLPLGCWTAAPARYSHEHTKEKKQERTEEKGATKNLMKTKLKLHKTLPNFAQMQFNLARTYSPKIIAWD